MISPGAEYKGNNIHSSIQDIQHRIIGKIIHQLIYITNN